MGARRAPAGGRGRPARSVDRLQWTVLKLRQGRAEPALTSVNDLARYVVPGPVQSGVRYRMMSTRVPLFTSLAPAGRAGGSPHGRALDRDHGVPLRRVDDRPDRGPAEAGAAGDGEGQERGPGCDAEAAASVGDHGHGRVLVCLVRCLVGPVAPAPVPGGPRSTYGVRADAGHPARSPAPRHPVRGRAGRAGTAGDRAVFISIHIGHIVVVASDSFATGRPRQFPAFRGPPWSRSS